MVMPPCHAVLESAMHVLGAEVNLLWSVLIFFTFVMVFFGGLVNFCETFLPSIINDAFRYGKVARRKGGRLLNWIEMPKAYFTHFYVFALIYVSSVLTLTLTVYVFNFDVWPGLMSILDELTTSSRRATTSAEAVVLALCLLWLQSGRRLYECMYVNVVTKNARMNILHYIVGYVHYFCAATGIVVEAPGFSSSSLFPASSLTLRELTWSQWLSAMLFVWSWYHQYKSHCILAETKRKHHGGYGLPEGDWFNYVTCPHYLAEVLMYFSLTLVLGLEHSTAIMVFLWVLINQSVAALMSHFWYMDKFKLPSGRKAIFPFIL